MASSKLDSQFRTEYEAANFVANLNTHPDRRWAIVAPNVFQRHDPESQKETYPATQGNNEHKFHEIYHGDVLTGFRCEHCGETKWL